MSVTITAQVTPNPDTLKFVVDQEIIKEGSIEFDNPEKAENSPLAAALFKLDGVKSVFVGASFVSVTKTNAVDWMDLAEPVTTTIQEAFELTVPLVEEALIDLSSSSEDDSDVVRRIKEILDAEVRPAVAMDGGDVVFDRFEEGVLYLHLQGACSSCPSATLTLKMGIEHRLKEDIPELEEVVQS